MTRPATLILFVLSALAGAVLFAVSYQVTELEDRLVALNKQVADDREALHVLHAEWSYLNQPERLATLSQRYLDLQPLDGAQMATVDTVPLRAPAAPDAAAAPAIVTAQLPSTPTTITGTLNAQPRAKPAAPRRPAPDAPLPALPIDRVAVQTAAATTDDNAALDAALRAIFGTRASDRGGAR